MNVAVLAPRRADNGWRDELWAWVRSDLEASHPAWAIVEGHHNADEGMFCRSAAVNRAAAAAGDWDVAVIVDCDVVAPLLAAAVDLAWAQGCMVVPHDDYVYLSEAGTRSIINGDDVPRYELAEWSEKSLGIAECVVRRDLFDRVGGLDERFVGHSWQDVAFHYACRGINGQIRLEGPLFHLWHPTDTATPEANRGMAIEYMDAFRENRMEAFLASRA